MSPFDWRLYRRWVLANGWSECLGLSATGGLGWWVTRSTAAPSSVGAVVGTALVAVAGGTLLEGVLVGYAQAQALRTRLVDFHLGRWVLATAIGAGVAWLLGMIPSTTMALAAPSPKGPPPAWLNGPAQYVLAAGMGLVLGPLLGVPQMLVLRRYARRAGRWVAANALAWAIGMPVVFLGVGAVAHETSVAVATLIIVLTTFGAGIAVGAVHGLILVRILSAPAGPPG